MLPMTHPRRHHRRSPIHVRPLRPEERAWATRLLTQRWGDARIVTRGRVHHADERPGLVAQHAGRRVGLLTDRFAARACEIVSLDSLREGRRIGTALLAAAVHAAQEAGARRVWLITTNDNLHALGFYQRRGFRLVAVHRDALVRSRRLKPQIPLLGQRGIPLRDEIELELRLTPQPARRCARR